MVGIDFRPEFCNPALKIMGEKQQTINKSIKSGFQYFITLINTFNLTSEARGGGKHTSILNAHIMSIVTKKSVGCVKNPSLHLRIMIKLIFYL